MSCYILKKNTVKNVKEIVRCFSLSFACFIILRINAPKLNCQFKVGCLFLKSSRPSYLSLISLGCHFRVRVRLSVTPSSCCSLECSVGCLSNNMSTAPSLDRSIDLDLLFCPLMHLTGAATPCWAPRPQRMILPAVRGQKTLHLRLKDTWPFYTFYAVEFFPRFFFFRLFDFLFR